MRASVCRWATLVVVVAVLGGAGKSDAYVRACKWNLTADVTVDINKDGFEKYGLSGDDVFRVMASVVNEWYVRAGLQYRFLVSNSFVSDTSAQAGHVLIKADDYNGTAVAVTTQWCGTGEITVHMQHMYHPPGFSEQGDESFDLFMTLLHEFGHVLGLDHSAATYTVLGATWSGVEELSHDDIDAIRNGHCTYGGGVTCGNCTLVSGTDYDCSYTRRTSTTLRGLRSGNDGSTWAENNTNFVDIGDSSNLEAGHAFGYNNSGSAKYVVAYVNSSSASDPIYIATGTGTSWTKYAIDTTNMVSEAGPTVAWGGTSTSNGYWVLVWQARTSSPDRQVYYSTTTNPSAAANWSARTAISVNGANIKGISRPMVTYAPTANKFVLTWIDRDTRVLREAVATPGATLTFTNDNDTQELSLHGPGLACVAGPGGTPTYDDCLFAWVYDYGPENMWTARGWTDPNYSYSLKTAQPKVQNTGDFTRLPVDVALKHDGTNGGASLAMLAWTGFTSPYNWYFTSKATTSQLTSWAASSTPTGPGSGIVSGPSLEYSSQWAEWTSVYAR